MMGDGPGRSDGVRDGTRDGTRARFTRLAAGAGGLALILVPTSLLLDASVRFDEQRHVVPGLLLAMIGIAGAIAVAWQRSTETRRGWWLRATFVACAVVWSGAGTYATVALAREVMHAVKHGRSCVAAGFQLTELVRCMDEARSAEVPEGLVKVWGDVLDEARREVLGLLTTLRSGHEDLREKTRFDEYYSEVLGTKAVRP